MLNNLHAYADIVSIPGRLQAASPSMPETTRSGNFYSASGAEYPYVLISGSYKDDSENDEMCALLGVALAGLQVGILSGAGKAGRSVSYGLFNQLVAEKKYDPDRIITYLRRKEKLLTTEVETIGTVKFYGSQPLELRKKMVFKSAAIICIGGGVGTKQEEQLASIHNIPVIPIAKSGGAALELWKVNMRYPVSSVQRFDKATFKALNSQSTQVAVEAALSLLKTSLLA